MEYNVWKVIYGRKDVKKNDYDHLHYVECKSLQEIQTIVNWCIEKDLTIIKVEAFKNKEA